MRRYIGSDVKELLSRVADTVCGVQRSQAATICAQGYACLLLSVLLSGQTPRTVLMRWKDALQSNNAAPDDMLSHLPPMFTDMFLFVSDPSVVAVWMRFATQLRQQTSGIPASDCCLLLIKILGPFMSLRPSVKGTKSTLDALKEAIRESTQDAGILDVINKNILTACDQQDTFQSYSDEEVVQLFGAGGVLPGTDFTGLV
jgi:hypothetical protein